MASRRVAVAALRELVRVTPRERRHLAVLFLLSLACGWVAGELGDAEAHEPERDRPEGLDASESVALAPASTDESAEEVEPALESADPTSLLPDPRVRHHHHRHHHRRRKHAPEETP